MTHMLRLFIVVATIFALSASVNGTPAFTGEVVVGTATGAPGEQIVVPVYLQNNDIGILALSVPLQYSTSDVSVDSVSFVGSLLKSDMVPLVQIENIDQWLRFTYNPTSSSSPITDESGLLASIYFSIDVSATEQTVVIDSLNKLLYSPPELWIRLEVADTTGINLFFPAFTPGEITIQTPLDADDDPFAVPRMLALDQNYPNPFNPSTTISFSIPERSHVNLRIFNVLGQEVTTLVDEIKSAGEYEIEWNAGLQASGIYFYRLQVEDRVLTKKMALLK